MTTNLLTGESVAISKMLLQTTGPNISAGYGFVLVGVLIVISLFTWATKESIFSWVASAFTVVFVGLWFLDAISVVFVWLSVIVNVLVLAIAGAVTKGNLGD